MVLYVILHLNVMDALQQRFMVWYGMVGMVIESQLLVKGGRDKKVIDNLVVNCLQQVAVNQFFRRGDWRLIFHR